MAPSEASGDGAPALSPARLNLLRDCERCFWVRMQRGESRPTEAFPSVVSGVEREVRALFDRHREAGTLPPALRTARLDATLVDDESFLTACRTWQREPTVTDPDTGAVLRGALDDLLELAGGVYVPLDSRPTDRRPRRYIRTTSANWSVTPTCWRRTATRRRRSACCCTSSRRATAPSRSTQNSAGFGCDQTGHER
ncbi:MULTISPECIES: hypothetical protein [Halolamina]|uniref:Uncharacterized protein n=1 Tax=Halolamina pelagica TaxID=699431 RepID=A0A1I5TYJ5_9EURY|nr:MULTISPECIES: hypothetical protein [Halolamina]NHX36687.1 hypothetical protein [Halolamina sp. R1-12]SFP87697.1 hypothetical protein SAMN05216277_1112 [Halolamina pelagica]